jgi:hypothetical protein
MLVNNTSTNIWCHISVPNTLRVNDGDWTFTTDPQTTNFSPKDSGIDGIPFTATQLEKIPCFRSGFGCTALFAKTDKHMSFDAVDSKFLYGFF